MLICLIEFAQQITPLLPRQLNAGKTQPILRHVLIFYGVASMFPSRPLTLANDEDITTTLHTSLDGKQYNVI